MGKITVNDGPSSNRPWWEDPEVPDEPVQDLELVDLSGDAREVVRKAMSEPKPPARTRQAARPVATLPVISAHITGV